METCNQAPAAQSTIAPEDKEGFTQIPHKVVAKPLHMTKETMPPSDVIRPLVQKAFGKKQFATDHTQKTQQFYELS